MEHNKTTPWVTHPWVSEGQSTIRFGLDMLDSRADWSVYHDSVQMAEELGFDSYYIGNLIVFDTAHVASTGILSSISVQ